MAQTENLALPLNLSGHIPMQKSVRRAFQIIDEAIAALQGGEGVIASEIAVTPAGDIVGTNVQAVLEELDVRIAALEAV